MMALPFDARDGKAVVAFKLESLRRAHDIYKISGDGSFLAGPGGFTKQPL
jgi:hypothetical protein